MNTNESKSKRLPRLSPGFPWGPTIKAALFVAEDGFSIGSNDLTQLTLGLDRDSGEMGSHWLGSHGSMAQK